MGVTPVGPAGARTVDPVDPTLGGLHQFGNLRCLCWGPGASPKEKSCRTYEANVIYAILETLSRIFLETM